MSTSTSRTLDLALALDRRGLAVAGLEVHTPDGRTWNVASVPEGRGRHADGHWGAMANAPGGFRLFEIDHDQNTIDEHEAVGDDTWSLGDLIDYLDVVGRAKVG